MKNDFCMEETCNEELFCMEGTCNEELFLYGGDL